VRVRGIPFSTTEDELADFFQEYSVWYFYSLLLGPPFLICACAITMFVNTDYYTQTHIDQYWILTLFFDNNVVGLVIKLIFFMKCCLTVLMHTNMLVI